MKKINKVISFILTLVMIMGVLTSCFFVKEEHKCDSICPHCGKCTDASCTEEACSDKCQGHEVDSGACSSVCSACGKCNNTSCTEPDHTDKCIVSLNPDTKYYTVSFDVNGANTTVPMQHVASGDKVLKPEDPTYHYVNDQGVEYDFVLEDWYKGENIWDFNQAVSSDLTLKAKWTFEDSFFAFKENASVRAEGTSVRAMSFNILSDDWNNKPPVDDFRISNVVNTVNRYLPDVIGFQETCDEWYEALSTELTSYKFVNYDTPVQNKLTKNYKQYTNYSTIMYNTEVLELIEWNQRYLSSNDNDNCRILTTGVFKVKATQERFVFMSTHWCLTLEGKKNNASEVASIVKEWEAKYPGCPVLVSGDFNSVDGSEPDVIFLRESGYLEPRETAEKVGLRCKTYHIGNCMFTGSKVVGNPLHWLRGRISIPHTIVSGYNTIDHIYTSPDVRTLYYDTIIDDDASNASDHLPIYCDFQFDNNDQGAGNNGFDGSLDHV